MRIHIPAPIRRALVAALSVTAYAAALDVTLPAGHWRIMGTNASHHGVRCGVVGSGTDVPTVHCRPDAAGDAFAPGRFNLVLTLGLDGRPEQTYSEVSLTAAGVAPEAVDTFPWVTP